MKPLRKVVGGCKWPDSNDYYSVISSKLQDSEGIAAAKEIFTSRKGVIKDLRTKQTKIQKKKLFLFPDLQETTDANVGVEFMKMRLSIL